MEHTALQILDVLSPRGYKIDTDYRLTKHRYLSALVISPNGHTYPIRYLPSRMRKLDITYYGLRLDDISLTAIADLMAAAHIIEKHTPRHLVHPLLVHDQDTYLRVHHPAPLPVLQTHQLINHILSQEANLP